MDWEDGHWFYITPAALGIARTSSALLSFARRFLSVHTRKGDCDIVEAGLVLLSLARRFLSVHISTGFKKSTILCFFECGVLCD